MKIKRIFAVVVIAMIALVLVACSQKVDYNALLESYLLDQPVTLTADFTLDSQLKVGENTYDLAWTSSSEYVKIADTAVSGTYTVTVTRPTEKQDVKITVKLGDATKDFNFQVLPVEVTDFVDAYIFKQDRTTVSESFDLDTEFEYNGLKATISWQSLDENYVAISEDGKTAEVTSSSVEKKVYLKATFSYNGVTSSKRFEVTVYEEMSALELIDYWYKNTGVSQTLSGYVVAIGTVYSTQYGNISLYMADDSLKAGYYLYRVKCSAEDAAKLAPGVHVVVEGTTNTNYNGLMETNAGGTLTCDGKDPINVDDMIIPWDDELISKSPSAIYRTSQLVSLTGWKITEKLNDPARDATKSIFKIERDGVSITLDLSKYCEGYFSPWASAADPKFDAIAEKIATFAVGDYIDITGIAGNYNGYQVHIVSADLINKSEEKAESLGKKVASVIESVVLPENSDGSSPIELTASTEDVTVTWSLTKESKYAKIEDGKLVLTPGKNVAKVGVIATYTNGAFSTEVLYYINLEAAKAN